MAVAITIPKLGLTMTEATLVKWTIGAGERIAAKQVVCVIETDKVSLEMEAPAAGWIHPTVQPGRRVAVGEVIGYIAVDEAELATLKARYAAAETGPPAVQAASPPAEKQPAAVPVPRPAASGSRRAASPAARKRCASLGLDLQTMAGSGPGGRIILADVEQAAATGRAGTPASYEIGSPTMESDLLGVEETVAIRGIRKIIARNMMLSLSRQAQLTLHTEASAEALRATRAVLNVHREAEQPSVSYNAIIVRAAALALRRFPLLNAVVEGREIRFWKQIHIGVAMDFGKGLIVPKVRHADTKPVPVIAGELADLVARAEKQRLLPDELQGGTFTITNLGSWEVDHFTPINNYPESAILGVGRIVEKPWVRDGAIVAEPRLALSLTIDHRIIDGALGARFLQSLKGMIEEPRLML